MKFLILTVSLLVLSSGCTSIKREGPPKAIPEKSVKVRREKRVKKAPDVRGAVWELLFPDKLTLQFQNIDNGNGLQIILDKGISERKVPAGHWELTGFEENGVSYQSMNTSRKFVFTMKKKATVYAGSIVLGCPKLDADQLNLLRSMKFFNRFPFSSSEGLCELVIGSDLVNVRKEVKAKKLIMGF